MINLWLKTLKHALDCGICFSQNRPTFNVTFVELIWKSGVMKTKPPALVAEPNGDAQTRLQHA